MIEHIDDEENSNVIRSQMQNDDLKVADKVADGILFKKEKKEKRKYLLLFLIFFIAFIFLTSTVFFNIFKIADNNTNVIESGSILFSYNEKSNSINISNAFPMEDDLGKQMSTDGEYFEFIVSTGLNSVTTDTITYEISLSPNITTLDSKYIRVYLTEDGNPISINSKDVNYYNDLPNSKIRDNSKVIYKKELESSSKHTYIFRMWLSNNYEIDNVQRKFSCFINVDAY